MILQLIVFELFTIWSARLDYFFDMYYLIEVLWSGQYYKVGTIINQF